MRPRLAGWWLAGLMAVWAGSAMAQPAQAPSWLPRAVAEIQALDKVYARRSALRVKAGETASYGALRITVAGCHVRPPDQPADATAFVTISEEAAGAAPKILFRGWMFAAAPALSMLAHPIYDIRLSGCAG